MCLAFEVMKQELFFVQLDVDRLKRVGLRSALTSHPNEADPFGLRSIRLHALRIPEAIIFVKLGGVKMKTHYVVVTSLKNVKQSLELILRTFRFKNFIHLLAPNAYKLCVLHVRLLTNAEEV